TTPLQRRPRSAHLPTAEVCHSPVLARAQSPSPAITLLLDVCPTPSTLVSSHTRITSPYIGTLAAHLNDAVVPSDSDGLALPAWLPLDFSCFLPLLSLAYHENGLTLGSTRYAGSPFKMRVNCVHILHATLS